MPGVTGSGSGHTIGVETGHTSVTGMETGHTCVFHHEYIVDGSSSLSESVSSSFIAQHRHACNAMLRTTSSHANVQPVCSMSHFARNTSPHTHSSPAIVGFSIGNCKMPYALRTRKPPRNDPLLTACHDALPPDILEYILLLRMAMPPRYPLRSRRRARARPIPETLGSSDSL